MANVLDSSGSSSDLLHCVVFLGNSGHFVKSLIPISFFYRVQLLANVPRTGYFENTLVLSCRSEENCLPCYC